MIFDELTEGIQKISNEKVVQDIVQYLKNWKDDDRNVDRLHYDFEKYLGNIRIETVTDFNKIYEMWKSFRDCAILNFAGMTMNERLYVFGLLDKFDTCKNIKEQNDIYEKLSAKRNNHKIGNVNVS
jgi:hypothetical protein